MKQRQSKKQKATKLKLSCSRLYSDRLRYSNIPTLRHRRYKGDMIESYKILHGIYDTTVSPCLPRCQFSAMRGNNFKLVKHYCWHELRKNSFTQRVINLWNSLPSYVVNSVSLNSFKTNVDKFWCSQNVYYDYKRDIAGTGNWSVSDKQFSQCIDREVIKKRTQRRKPASDTLIRYAVVYYTAVQISHITDLAGMSNRPSVLHTFLTPQQTKHRQSKIGANVQQERSNQSVEPKALHLLCSTII